ncbi:MAG: hypothetical protein EXR31_07755 [Betaproteobacteria bacterium]|nr:hypothetical protein [Betaproteobacteria bacterium]
MASDLPEAALAELRRGRTVEAIRIVRETQGIGLKDAKERIDAAIARDPSLRASGGSPVAEAIGDYLASSSKFPLAAGLGVGAGTLWLAGTFFPHAGKDYDPGFFILVAMGAPLAATAIALMVWARRWRARRAAAAADAAAAAAPDTAPARPRFGGLPDPGATRPPTRAAALSAPAMAAIDRGDMIEAIKIVRTERNLGLAEAKALVDAAKRARDA